MKKYIGIVVVIVCIAVLSDFTNVGISNIKMHLPELHSITEIEMIESNTENRKKIVDKKEIVKLVDNLENNFHLSYHESINDQPVNVDKYITIKFYDNNSTENNVNLLYLYQRKGNSYVEQPYLGIWRLKNNLFDLVDQNLK